ncbi:MAG TPA: hypothetical protein VFS86_00855 [Rhodanobacteraceae bacterium]|jgi:hypothetical protein|nr:hypothetical protein [Rhodanobacteraceae bacterium]
MKHLSVWLALLLLGGMPLTAAALDYGPNSPLLAADTNVPQLPDAQVNAVARGEMPKPDVAADNEGAAGEAAAPQRMTPSTASRSAHAATLPRNPGPSASNKPRVPVAHPVPAPPTAAWQSLLPGSIQ